MFASNNIASPKLCTERECFSCIQTLSQNPCHLCPPYLPTMWYFLPFQVNTSCATFKTFKIFLFLCQCLLAHEELVWSFFILFFKWTFTPGLVAYTSAYPITCKKSWQMGCPVPINYNFNHLILFTSLPMIYQKKIPKC